MRLKYNTNYFNQNGVTLIALVVTIVVLLILAGVAINAVLGQNGLINQIEVAKKKNAIAEYIDDINLKLLEAQMNTINDKNKILEETKRLVVEDKKYNEATIGEIEGDNKFTIITKEGYKIDVKKDGATYVEKVTETEQNKDTVYATLYTDGTLAFSNDDSEISGKTVVTKYGDISKLQLKESKVVDNINETEYHHPWLNAYGITKPMGILQEDYEQLNTKIKNAIKNITFVNKVSLNSTAYLFAELTGVTEISNLNYLDTSNVRDMSYMFGNCEALKKVEFNVLNTSRVTNMEGLFQNCIKLEEINMNGINTENVTDMSVMFAWCTSLKKLDLSSFNTSNVTDMLGMFAATKVLMDLSKFDTKNVTNMTAMFSGYQGTYLDLASFDTNKVTDFHNMFNEAIDLKHIIVDSGWNVSNQADVDNMFYSCGTNTVTYKKNIDTTITLNDYGFSNNHVYTEVGKGTTGFLFKPDKTVVAFSNGADQTAYFMQEFQASRMYWDVQNGKVVVVIEKTNGDSVILPVETSNNGRTITTINPFTQAQAEYYITLENYHEIYTGRKYYITLSKYEGQYIIVNSDNTITLSSGLEEANVVATYMGQGCMILQMGDQTAYGATIIDGTKLVLSNDGQIVAELRDE